METIIKKGYNEARGDSVGVIFTSSGKPMLIYSRGDFEIGQKTKYGFGGLKWNYTFTQYVLMKLKGLKDF